MMMVMMKVTNIYKHEKMILVLNIQQFNSVESDGWDEP